MTTEMTRNMNALELGHVLLEALGDDHFFVTNKGLGLRIGDVGWRWPGAPFLYGSEQSAIQHGPTAAKEHEIDLDAGPEYTDSRLTIRDVQRLVARAEREAYMRLNHVPAGEARHHLGGAWNEYLEPCFGLDASQPWPHDCYMAVYVIPGANEGLSLRVTTVDDDQRFMLTGKALGMDWHECYASASRISALLNQ